MRRQHSGGAAADSTSWYPALPGAGCNGGDFEVPKKEQYNAVNKRCLGGVCPSRFFLLPEDRVCMRPLLNKLQGFSKGSPASIHATVNNALMYREGPPESDSCLSRTNTTAPISKWQDLLDYNARHQSLPHEPS